MAILNQLTGSGVHQKTTVVAGADTAGSLTSKSFAFETVNAAKDKQKYQPYFKVDGVGLDPTIGNQELTAFTPRADASWNLLGKYFNIYDKTDRYHLYHTVAGITGYDPKIGRKEVFTATFRSDVGKNYNNKYWLLYNNTTKYHIAYVVEGETFTDPAPVSSELLAVIPVKENERAALIAKKTALALRDRKRRDLFDATYDGNVMTVTVHAYANSTDAADGDVGGDFAIAVLTHGVAPVGALALSTGIPATIIQNITDQAVGASYVSAFNNSGAFTATYTQSISGYQECGLTGKEAASATGLATTSTYYFGVQVDGGDAEEHSVTTISAVTYADVIALMNTEVDTAVFSLVGGDLRCTSKSIGAGSAVELAIGTQGLGGYQEAGLTTKTPTTETGLSASSTYYFKVNIDDAGAVQYDITTGAGADDTKFAAVIDLLNAELTGAGFGLNGGDLRCISDTIVAGSSIALAAGDKGLGGYHGVGLTGKEAASATGLDPVGTYYFKVNIDGAGAAEYSIVTGADVTYADVIPLMNTEISGASFGLSGGDLRCTSDNIEASSTVVLTAGTSGDPGYQECGLSAKTGGLATGLSPTTTYYFKVNIDGAGEAEYSIATEADVSFDTIIGLVNSELTGASFGLSGGDLRCTSESTVDGSAIALAAGTTGYAAYQECGLSALTGASATGLAATSIYYFKVDIDDAGALEYSITTASGTTYADIIALMNSELTGATVSLEGGDLRCTSDNIEAGSNMLLAAGTSGDPGYNVVDVGSDKIGSTETGLSASTKYYFRADIDGGGEVEYDITTSDGADDTKYTAVIALMDAELSGATFSLEDGDLRCTSASTATGSAVTLLNGTSGIPGYNDVLVNSDKTGGTETGLAASTTYYFRADIDGGGLDEYNITTSDGVDDTKYTAVIALLNSEITGAVFSLEGGDLRCTSDSTATGSAIALQAGLSGIPGYNVVDVGSNKTGSTETGLSASTQYYFKVNIDGAGQAEYNITTSDGVDDTKYDAVIALLNSEITGAAFSLEGGDLRCTSASTAHGSAIALAVGTSGSDLFANLTNYSAINAPVALTVMDVFATLTNFSAIDAPVALVVMDLFATLTNYSEIPAPVALVIMDLYGTLNDFADFEVTVAQAASDVFANLTGFAIFDSAVAFAAKDLYASLSGFSELGTPEGLTVMDFFATLTGFTELDSAHPFALMCLYTSLTNFASFDSPVARVTPKANVTTGQNGVATDATDGDIGGAFSVSVTTQGTNANGNIPIPVSIAKAATNVQVATALEAALLPVCPVLVDVTRSNQNVVIENRYPGDVAATADPATNGTGWSLTESTAGTDTFTTNMITSATNAVYRMQHDDVCFIKKLVITLGDGDVSNIAKFGDLNALTTGVSLERRNRAGTVQETITNLKTNLELLSLGRVILYSATNLIVELDLEEAYGKPMRVYGPGGEYFAVSVPDNPNGLVHFSVRTQGYTV